MNYLGIRVNVTSGQDQVLFGLRGCKIVSGASEGAFVNSVQLSEDLPDHFLFLCVLGVWKRSARQIAVLTGSTVPNWGLYYFLCFKRSGKYVSVRLGHGVVSREDIIHYTEEMRKLRPEIKLRR